AAAEGCYVDPETGKSCRSFHLPRTYFRIFGIMGGTWAHRGMYERGLAPLLREGAQPRILVSGTADHSLYSVLLGLARNAGAEPEFTVTDLCPTPLALTRWYADYVGGSDETVAADAVGFADRGPFDAICTHLFLGWIPADRRVELLKSWAALLRPGGRVVTNATVRVGTDAKKGTRGPRFAPGQLEAFEAAAVSRAHAWKDFVGVAPETIASMAAQFLPNWRSRFAPNTPDGLEAMFDEAGFDLEMELVEVPSMLRPDWNPAPGVDRSPSGGRKEALLIAVRRGA
ncbi:MAG: class I SAM-dependent methyltransferase, partial [Deltaproteobacteria bacterium]|nr:class I SAM-dependent methyltransferase [Deltaproteobacteria bacterium]